MNVKTMEGLAGAGTSIRMVSTPMSAAKEAERKGDTDKMMRALSYAAKLTDQADTYSEKASQGMELDAEESKEQEKLRQEKVIQARIEERAQQKKAIEAAAKNSDVNTDSVEIGQEARHLAETDEPAVSDSEGIVWDVTYDKAGETATAVQGTGENVDVSV